MKILGCVVLLTFLQTPNAWTSSFRHHGHLDRKDEEKPSYSIERSQINYFAMENNTIVVAQEGSTAVLHCFVTNIKENTVSWIRVTDYYLLTVGNRLYSRDTRFKSVQNAVLNNSTNLQDIEDGTSEPTIYHQYCVFANICEDWQLNIRYLKQEDAGMYECQVSSYPPASVLIELQVVKAVSDIIGAPDKFVRKGSQLHLTCLLHKSTEPPEYFFWYKTDVMINYSRDQRMTVFTDRHSSVLRINPALPRDSGNYTCSPSNTLPSSIIVHVIDGEEPAAVYDNSGTFTFEGHSILRSVAVVLCIHLTISVLTQTPLVVT